MGVIRKTRVWDAFQRDIEGRGVQKQEIRMPVRIIKGSETDVY